MFKKLPLKATYSSYEEDLGSTFYSPVLENSISYDRATAYFSGKSLANYGKGLECYAQSGNVIRLLISSEISKEDYEQICEGYTLRGTLESDLISQLKENISLEEKRNISNLAFLVSIGIIEIKIAFTQEGIFHDKFGIMEDANGDIICFRGSNNETDAALHRNYEAFDITCSWQVSEFDYAKITKSRETFELLWNDKMNKVRVCDFSETLQKELLSFSKGKILIDTALFEDECVILDFKEKLTLSIKIDPMLIFNSSAYKLKIKKYADLQLSDETLIQFKTSLLYPDYRKIIEALEKCAEKGKFCLIVTNRVLDYINNRELYIRERSKIGLAVKAQESQFYEKFSNYRDVVNESMVRELRDKQMWDSFYMCIMKKSFNFSVPGSGKTASVLGVFAYLQSRGLVNRIIMVGPKNSFDSWKDEFSLCFGERQALKLFNIHDSKYRRVQDKKSGIALDTGNKNLLLFNYEGIGSYLDDLKKIITPDTLLVYDEVHRVKAVEGIRSDNAIRLAENATYAIALTGTPIPNSYEDIYSLLKILYKDEYKDFFGFSPKQLKNPTEDEIDVINQKLQPFFCRTSKKELQVPPASPDTLYPIFATEEESELFHILTVKYAKNKFALIIRLLQLTSNPKMLLQTLDMSDFADILDISQDIDNIDYVDFSEDVESLIKKITNTSKFNGTIELALNLHKEKKPVIIWCIFKDSISRLSSELDRLGVRTECIYGDVKTENRSKILNAFRNGQIDVLVTNPHTLAESVSLHSVCHDAIYFECSYNLVHLLQSKDRIHRLGLDKDQYTQYYFMQEYFISQSGVEYSLDCEIYNRLLEKEEVMLNAIESGILETVTTSEEDVELIFSPLGL